MSNMHKVLLSIRARAEYAQSIQTRSKHVNYRLVTKCVSAIIFF